MTKSPALLVAVFAALTYLHVHVGIFKQNDLSNGQYINFKIICFSIQVFPFQVETIFRNSVVKRYKCCKSE